MGAAEAGVILAGDDDAVLDLLEVFLPDEGRIPIRSSYAIPPPAALDRDSEALVIALRLVTGREAARLRRLSEYPGVKVLIYRRLRDLLHDDLKFASMDLVFRHPILPEDILSGISTLMSGAA